MSYAKSVSAASLAASLAIVLMISANALTTGNAASTDARAATTPSGGPASFSQASNASPNGNLARGDRTFMRKAAQGGMAGVELGRIATPTLEQHLQMAQSIAKSR